MSSPAPRPTRVLVMCREGNNRSQTIAQILRYNRDPHGFRFDVLAFGFKTAHEDTIAMLTFWADHIIVVEPYMLDAFPQHPEIPPLHLWDVGPDTYPRPHNKELLAKVQALINAHVRDLT